MFFKKSKEKKRKELEYNSIIEKADDYFNQGNFTKAQDLYLDASVVKKNDSYADARYDECYEKKREQLINLYGEDFGKAIYGMDVIVGMNTGMVNKSLGRAIETGEGYQYFTSHRKEFKRVKVQFNNKGIVKSVKYLKT
jgi:hypothetical protein